MLNVELPNGTPNMVLKGASLTQHSTFNTQHSSNDNIQRRRREDAEDKEA